MKAMIDQATPDHIEQLVASNAGAIAWAAAEVALASPIEAVVLLVDLEGAEEGELRVAEFFGARTFGSVAVAPMSLRDARGLVTAAVENSTSLRARLRETPPVGYVHVLVMSRVFGRVALTFGRVIPGPTVFAA